MHAQIYPFKYGMRRSKSFPCPSKKSVSARTLDRHLGVHDETVWYFLQKFRIAMGASGNFIEDNTGNIWFAAENVGVYKYDGAKFTLYTTEDGLTSKIMCSAFLKIIKANFGLILGKGYAFLTVKNL